jgi:hypothetical protein
LLLRILLPKRRGKSFIEQEESDSANGLVEHATAVDTQNRSGTATAPTSRQRRAVYGAEQREPRRSRSVPKEERQFVGERISPLVR